MEKAPQSEKQLDAAWFDRLAELSVESYLLLDGDAGARQVEKEKFLSGATENPELDYPKLNEFDFVAHEKSLLALKQDIQEQEPNDIVRVIYLTKINENLAELRMLQSTRNGDDRRFHRYSTFVYGKPDIENTRVMSDIVQEKVSRGITEIKQTAAQALRPVLEAQVAEISARGEALITVEDSADRIQSIDEVVAAFEAALIKVEATDGWRVVVNPDNGITNFRVSQKNKEVHIPAGKVVGMLTQEMAAFVQHEIYGHVQRRVQGERSKLKLLSIGLDRVEKGEEGVATFYEQQVKGADTYSHPERYFAIALAQGDIDGIKRDFRQTFEVLKNYYIAVLKSSKQGPTLEEKASDWAWRLAVRVFRGTTGKTPGAVFTKDLNYFVGNKETWALVNTSADVVTYFSIGKFDAANPRHVGWLTELGITDEMLTQIQSEAFST